MFIFKHKFLFLRENHKKGNKSELPDFNDFTINTLSANFLKIMKNFQNQRLIRKNTGIHFSYNFCDFPGKFFPSPYLYFIHISGERTAAGTIEWVKVSLLLLHQFISSQIFDKSNRQIIIPSTIIRRDNSFPDEIFLSDHTGFGPIRSVFVRPRISREIVWDRPGHLEIPYY